MPDDERVINVDTAAFDELFEIEPLHPDLVPYLEERPHLGWVIHHPLVVTFMHHEPLNKMVNRRYAVTKEALEQAAAQENWPRYVFTHERPYRFDALMEVMDRAGYWDLTGDGTAYWELVSEVWTDSENIFQYLDGWRDLWSSDLLNREAVMDEKERAALAALPDMITVWRGSGHRGVAKGLSWTLSKEKAAWFARRYPDKVGAFVAHGAVRKTDVLAHFLGRNEVEIVVLPEHVTNIKVRKIADRR